MWGGVRPSPRRLMVGAARTPTMSSLCPLLVAVRPTPTRPTHVGSTKKLGSPLTPFAHGLPPFYDERRLLRRVSPDHACLRGWTCPRHKESTRLSRVGSRKGPCIQVTKLTASARGLPAAVTYKGRTPWRDTRAAWAPAKGVFATPMTETFSPRSS